MSLFLLLSFLTLSYSGAFYSINVMFKLPMLSVPLGYSGTLLQHPLSGPGMFSLAECPPRGDRVTAFKYLKVCHGEKTYRVPVA